MGGLGNDSTALVNGVNYVKSQGVDFSNASIAFHGYTDATSLQNGINAAHYDSVPLALTCTEWATSDTGYVGTYEYYRANWMYFTWLTANDGDLSIVTSAIGADGLHWTPDWGTYPGCGGPFKLIARHSGKALDANNNGTANGTQIIQWTYGGGANQQWLINSLGFYEYSIIGVQSGKCIDIDNWGTANGTKVQLWDYSGGSNEKFRFNATDSGYYEISPSHASGSCLDVSGASANDGANVQLWQWGGGANQQWALQPIDGNYKMFARHSNKAMEAAGFGTANGTQIQQWTYANGDNQQWYLTDVGSGNYKIIGLQSSRAVDINNSGTDNGTKVQLWDYSGGANQLYKITGLAPGYFRITPNCASGSCLDVSGASTADGALVQLWQWGGGNNQQWTLYDPPLATATPTGLSAASSTAQVALTWKALSGATSYKVKRSIISNGPYTTIATVTTTSYSNTGLVNGTKYYYVVSAVKSSGETGNSSQVAATPIAAPTGLSATAGTKQVALSWAASIGAQTYNVYRGTAAGQEGGTPVASGISTTSYTNTGLTTGTTYYYKVAAVNFSGTSSLSSEVSAKAK